MSTSEERFDALLASVPESKRAQFDAYVRRAIRSKTVESESDDAPSADDEQQQQQPDDLAERLAVLEHIRQFLKERVPTGEAPEEGQQRVFPRREERIGRCAGDWAYDGFTEETTQVVDSFLFPDDEAVDEACEEGILGRAYCLACHSFQEVRMMDFVSHSLSETQLRFVMTTLTTLMPAETEVSRACLVDIGSRLGVVLYAAHIFTSIPRLVGIEKNGYFANLTTETVAAYNMGSRTSVIADDVRNCTNTLKEATIVVMNNVFEWFADTSLQNVLWESIISALRPGTILVTYPSVDESIRNNSLSIPSRAKLQLIENEVEYPVEEEPHALPGLSDLVFSDEEVEDCAEIKFYRVI